MCARSTTCSRGTHLSLSLPLSLSLMQFLYPASPLQKLGVRHGVLTLQVLPQHSMIRTLLFMDSSLHTYWLRPSSLLGLPLGLLVSGRREMSRQDDIFGGPLSRPRHAPDSLVVLNTRNLAPKQSITRWCHKPMHPSFVQSLSWPHTSDCSRRCVLEMVL